MRDFRDAKTMAQTLRKALKTRSLNLTHSESLELIAQILGLRDWNVLAAKIQEAESETPPSAPVAIEPPIGLPVIAMRDVVVFPHMTIPLFVGRARTVRAVERAMVGDKRVLLLAQKRSGDDDPDADGLHAIGVIAQLLQVQKLPDGSLKLMVTGVERARVVRLVKGEMLQAEHEPVAPAPADRGAALVPDTLQQFEQHANVDLSSPPQALMRLSQIRNPALLSDILAQHLSMSVDQAQALLETVDPGERLETLIAIMQAARRAA